MKKPEDILSEHCPIFSPLFFDKTNIPTVAMRESILKAMEEYGSEKKGLTDRQRELLNKVFAAIWIEANYDPYNEATREFAAPLSDIMDELNKELKFKL